MKDMKNLDDIRGQALYKLFNKTVELDVFMRQQGPEQDRFRDALEGLRNNALTITHWDLLKTQVQAELSSIEVRSFADALHLYGRKDNVNSYNHKNMRDLNVSVRQLKAHHIGGKDAEKTSFDTAGNLHATLPLCIGARVMLTENLWTEKGLVNGAIGTVCGLHWSADQDINKALPTVLLQFDKYDGPTLLAENFPVVPIVPSSRDFEVSKSACTRTQVPLTIAWAITIQKSHGITAAKVVTNLADKEHVVGLHYVAVSRVKKLQDIMFEVPFDFSRFRSAAPTKTEVMRLADYATRLVQHVPEPVPNI